MMVSLRRTVFLSLAVAGVAMLAVPVSASAARLVWNASPSAPTGLYSIDHGAWHVGDRVGVWPPNALAVDLDRRGVLPHGKLLIKRVVAGPGDTVCRAGVLVSINGSQAANAMTATDSGSPLPVWTGCQTLGSSEVFLLGDTANSYDGRYFGVTSSEDIVGRVSLLLAM